MAFSDKPSGKLQHLGEIVTGVGDAFWFVAHPSNICQNILNIFMGFRLGVSIIVAQVANPSTSLCSLKIYPHRLDMADMQVPVGLRGEPEAQPPLRDF